MSSPDPAKVNLGQTIEEALGKLTHQCRKNPTLKLRPEVCSKRKATKQKIAGGKSYQIFSFCADCPGPIPIPGEEVPAQNVSKPSKIKKKLSPTACNLCGRTEPEARFYPSNPHTCAKCLYERERQRRLSIRKTYEEVPEIMEPAIEEPPPETAVAEQKSQVETGPPTVEPEVIPETYECKIHGLHSGRMFGRQHSKICPKCYFEKASAKMKAVRARERNSDPSKLDGVTLPGWIVAWADEQGVEKGVPGRELIIGMIGERIPAEWIKQYFLNGKS